jgi:hypothetical protein
MGTLKFQSTAILSHELQTLEAKLPVPGVPILPPGVVAPEPQTLSYLSTTKLYGIAGGAEPADGEFEGFNLRETLGLTPVKGLPPEVREYTLSIERTIKSSDELLTASSDVRTFLSDLDKFWIYATGEPLNPMVKRVSLERGIAGWSHNEVQVRDYLVRNCHQILAVLADSRDQHWVVMRDFPLLPALRARRAYKSATPSVQALVDLHYSALKSSYGEGRLFGLAKALELARHILPGKDGATKQQVLADLIGRNLRHSLDWLKQMGNDRYHTRHAVQKGPTVQLKPKMTGEEIGDFEHDADLILRATVFRELKLT